MARRPRSRCLAVVLGLWLSGCIVSVDGLTGGAATDASSDATSDGSLDAPSDGIVPPADAPADSIAPDGRKPDTGPIDAACAPVGLDGGSVVACPAPPDGATCFTQALPNFQPTWIPPRPTVSVCTATQLSDFATDCLGTASQAMCSTFQMDGANAACLNCMVSPMTLSQQVYGPLLQGMNFELLNIGGCIALADPCQMGCAAAWEAKQECEAAACGPVCPVTNQTTGNAYEACLTEADTCTCSPEATVAQACQQALMFGPAAECFPTSGFVNAAQTLGMLFCGGG